MLVDLKRRFLLFFHFYVFFVVFYAFAEPTEQVYQANYLNLAQLVHFLIQLALGREQDLHGGTQPRDLHLPIKPTLVAADAIENARYIIELVLDLVQQQLLTEVLVLILKEARLVETVRAFAYGLSQQVGHVDEGQLIVLLA